MPDFFAALPTWAIIAIFALMAAAAGGAGTYFLRRRFPNAVILRYLPVMATVAGAALGTLIALPTISAEARPVTCEGAQAVATEANSTDAGRQIDAIITAIDVRVDCAAMTITFRQAVAMELADVTDAEWQTATTNVSENSCGNPLWRRYIDAGWTLVSEYNFENNGVRSLTATCG